MQFIQNFFDYFNLKTVHGQVALASDSIDGALCHDFA
jgi:hypothetical protein